MTRQQSKARRAVLVRCSGCSQHVRAAQLVAGVCRRCRSSAPALEVSSAAAGRVTACPDCRSVDLVVLCVHGSQMCTACAWVEACGLGFCS